MPSSPLKSLALMLYSIDLLLVTAFVLNTNGVGFNSILYPIINLDAEGSIAAWFSSSKLFAAGFVFAAAAYVRPNNSVRPVYYALWALAFFFLSADEAVGLHEKVTLVFRDVEFLPRFSGNHGIWIPLYFLAGLAFIAVTGRTSLRLWRSGNSGITILFVGIVVFVCGAVILEVVSYGELRELVNRRSYLVLVAVEEAFELVGVSTILIGSVMTCFAHDLPST